MPAHHLNITLLPGLFAVCRLSPQDLISDWLSNIWSDEASVFSTITRTAEEVSLVCPQDKVPEGVRSERDFRLFRLGAQIDFSTIGIIASVADPLAAAGISIFPIATFDTDYLLIKESQSSAAAQALKSAGHRVNQ